MNNHPEILFAEAIKLTHHNFFVDAIKKYQEFAYQYPENEFADDALFNAGLCYFHIHLFHNAIGIFKDIIEKYPDADINISDGKEFGKTSVKCMYAIINCYLGLNDIDSAKMYLKQMEAHKDSYIYTELGQKITYHQLAEKAINSYSQIITNL